MLNRAFGKSGLLAIAFMAVLAACSEKNDEASGAGETASAAPAAFKPCAVCHSVEDGARPRNGPSLHGILGKTSGTVEGYRYSPAMSKSGIVWTPESLDQFLSAPTKMVPGSRMTNAVSDAEQRKAIVTYLQNN